MHYIQKNIQNVRQYINYCAKIYNRNTQEILMIVVTKNQTINNIAKAIEMKETHFGENYVQESLNKIQYFKKNMKNYKLVWHYIGSIQSNKTRYIAENFDWCHTIDNEYIAYRLHKHRPTTLSPLNVLIQINISLEKTKSGIHPNELVNLSNLIKKYPQLNLRGIMCIPKYEREFNKQVLIFKNMKKLFNILQQTQINIDMLSIGMSKDMEAAIAAGSTLVRIGQAIFKEIK